MKINISKFEKILKIKFNNKKNLIDALTHKSSNKEINNEKLEFLGDRVIALILSKKLFDLYPNESEGVLDKRFSQLVNKKAIASVAWNLDLKNFIIIGNKKKILKNDEKILSDACEALIGAIFIDLGFAHAKKFVLEHWEEKINNSNVTVLDSKTKLQEFSLKTYKKLPIYKLQSSIGPKHKPTFKMSVSINNSQKFIGYGNSKQQAEQNAAKKLLKNINIL